MADEKNKAPKRKRDVIPPKGQQSYPNVVPPRVGADKTSKGGKNSPVAGK
jgi:hypothetical protein